MIKVTNEIRLYEIDNSISDSSSTITIESHWNNHNMIVIDTGKQKLTIKSSDLLAAIENATNTAKF